MLRTATPLAIFAMATALNVAAASAQTLTDPDPKPAPLSAPAKAPVGERVKTCSAYGAGFVQLPGTDACVKIGGFVRTEATESGR
jgi:hypothetical protein